MQTIVEMKQNISPRETDDVCQGHIVIISPHLAHNEQCQISPVFSEAAVSNRGKPFYYRKHMLLVLLSEQ